MISFFFFVLAALVFVAAHALSLVVVHRLLIVEASSVVESGLSGLWASAVAAHGFSSCGT